MSAPYLADVLMGTVYAIGFMGMCWAGYEVVQAAGRHHDRMLAARRREEQTARDVRAAQKWRDEYNARWDLALWDREMER